MLNPQDLVKILDQLLERDFKPPLTFAAVALNGATGLGRFVPVDDGDGLSCEILHKSDHADWLTPINLMFVDATGEAARVVIDASRWPTPQILH